MSIDELRNRCRAIDRFIDRLVELELPLPDDGSPDGERLALRWSVRFVVIGGYAVAAHGYERATRDMDIVFATDLETCERFAAVLGQLEARVRVATSSSHELAAEPAR